MKPLFLVSALIASSLSLPALRLMQPQGEQNIADADIDLPKSDSSGTDIVRFNNGDLIHGKFEGLNGGIEWSRPDLEGKVRFKLKNLRQVVFDGARQTNSKPLQAHVSLVNGDQIPGEIISLDAEHIVLKSPLAGDLKIPRQQIKSLTPNPYDGQLKYAGPFTSDGWVMLDRKGIQAAREEEAEEQIKAAEDAQEEGGEEAEQKEEAPKEPKPSWIYSGASLYSTNLHPIAYDADLPDVGRLRFKVAWRSRLYLSLAFHADFTRPLPREVVEEEKGEAAEREAAQEEDEPKPEEALEEEEEELPPLNYESLFDQVEGKALQTQEWLPKSGTNQGATVYGSSYVLTLNGSYPGLARHTFDEDGNPKITALRSGRISTSFSNEGEAEFDLRFDRIKSVIYLYVNGQYACQWNDLEGYAGKGGAISFASMNATSRVKISDVLVTSWSGTQDSAKSMNHEERDIALLTNGTDRFSGETASISNGTALFKSEFSEMTIPLDQLSEINFKTKGLADPEEIEWSDQIGTILFQPIGRITLTPKSSSATQLKGHSPILGDVTVDLSSAVLMNFSDDPDGLSEWLTDF